MLETPEEEDAFRHVEQMKRYKHPWDEHIERLDNLKFAGNYQGPLYAPHPDIKSEEKPNQVASQSEPRKEGS